MKKHLAIIIIFVFTFAENTFAQCAMCKAAVESNNASGENVAKGLNDGITLMMIIPYALIGLVGYFLYKRMVKNNS